MKGPVKLAAGRKVRPPYYTRDQLDDLCEKVLHDFCLEFYGQELTPVPTDVLSQLLEYYTHDLDQFAELPPGIHGVTLFYTRRKPTVQIAAELKRQHWRENRERSTLAHECGHAILHTPMWRDPKATGLDEEPVALACSAESIAASATLTQEPPDQYDEWMEWQARYMSGALLMQKSRVLRLVERFIDSRRLALPLQAETPTGADLIDKVTFAFQVSRDAARVRLTQLGALA
jgi:hypothetical protein